MSIYIVRHGETNDNAKRIVQLPTAELSASGHEQARLLAVRLEGQGVSRILCSDFTRTQQTAAYINTLTGVDIQLDTSLRERSFGDLRGKPYSAIDADIFAANYAPPNGETWNMFEQRIAKAWQKIIKAAKDTKGNLLVVTHGFVCRSLIQYGQLPESVITPDHWGNTSLTILDKESPWLIHTLNCTNHLDASEINLDGAKA